MTLRTWIGIALAATAWLTAAGWLIFAHRPEPTLEITETPAVLAAKAQLKDDETALDDTEHDAFRMLTRMYRFTEEPQRSEDEDAREAKCVADQGFYFRDPPNQGMCFAKELRDPEKLSQFMRDRARMEAAK